MSDGEGMGKTEIYLGMVVIGGGVWGRLFEK